MCVCVCVGGGGGGGIEALHGVTGMNLLFAPLSPSAHPDPERGPGPADPEPGEEDSCQIKEAHGRPTAPQGQDILPRE